MRWPKVARIDNEYEGEALDLFGFLIRVFDSKSRLENEEIGQWCLEDLAGARLDLARVDDLKCRTYLRDVDKGKFLNKRERNSSLPQIALWHALIPMLNSSLCRCSITHGNYPLPVHSPFNLEANYRLLHPMWQAGRHVSAAEHSSHRRHAAVHEQQGAGDVGGIVGGQEQDRGGDLLGSARALQHGAFRGAGVRVLHTMKAVEAAKGISRQAGHLPGA